MFINSVILALILVPVNAIVPAIVLAIVRATTISAAAASWVVIFDFNVVTIAKLVEGRLHVN